MEDLKFVIKYLLDEAKAVNKGYTKEVPQYDDFLFQVLQEASQRRWSQ
jgi:hypothetical protein